MIKCDSNNYLRINLTGILRYNCEVAISPWDKGISWTAMHDNMTNTHSWHEELGIPLSVLLTDKSAQSWVMTIPEPVRLAIDGYGLIYNKVLFSTLFLISRYEHAYEFFFNQPRIMWLILYHAKLNGWDEFYVADLLKRTRKNILAACGLPGRKSALNFLSKLSFRTFARFEYENIRSLLASTDYCKLNQLRQVNGEILSFLKEYPELYSSRFLLNYNDSMKLHMMRSDIIDIMRMARTLAINDIQRRICLCADQYALKKLHDKLVHLINKLEVVSLQDITYMLPPIKGSINIIPIISYKDLVIEGQVQHNCIKSYHDQIYIGRYYVYKVLSPERATLGLKIRSNGKWAIDQLRLCANRRPSESTVNYVQSWFLGHE